MAIYSPGMDFFKALDAVRYLLSCDPQKDLIQKYVTFHFYFDRNHTPKDVSFNLMFFFKRNPQEHLFLVIQRNKFKSH